MPSDAPRPDDLPHPADALAMAQSARRRIAERARTPWWYPPAYGTGVGGMVASLALPDRLILVGFGAAIALLLVAYGAWQRVSGLSVSGFRPGATRRIARRLGLAMAVAFAAAVVLRTRVPGGWGPIACGTVLAVVAARASAAWDRAWRAELRGAAE